MGNLHSNTRLNVIESRDFEIIKGILLEDDIRPFLIPDVKKCSWKNLDDELATYYLLYSDSDIVGIVILKDMSSEVNCNNTFGVDIGILKPWRGRAGFNLGSMALSAIWKKIANSRLFCIIKADNLGSIAFSKRMGFRIIMKDGKHYFLEAKNG